MDKFLKYVDKLPQPLNADEQKKLFIKYGQTKNQQIRQTLLEHNLRLAAQKAIDWAQKYNMNDRIFDINSECCFALVKAMDAFDANKPHGASFAYFAYRLMDMYLLKMLGREEKHSSAYIQDLDKILARDKHEELYGDIVEKFHDPDTSRVAEDLIYAEFLEEILNVVSDEHREMFKMSWGIGYPKKYTYAEIAENAPYTRQRVGQIMDKELENVRRYIATKYPEYSPQAYKNYNGKSNLKKQFSDLLDKYKYITYSYYGIRGYEHKSSRELALLFDTSSTYITDVKNKFMEGLSEAERKAILAEAKPKKKPHQNIAEQVFNDYFGVNGSKIHSITEIQRKYKELPITSTTPIYNILHQVAKHKVSSGQYTEIQMQEIKESREERKRAQTLEEGAELYFTYYGQNGYDKKTQRQLSEMLQTTPENVSLKIKTYRDYLSSLSPAERKAEIEKHNKQASQKE